MSTNEPCSSYRQGGLCADGFPQNTFCVGYRCHGCGRLTDAIPACMREDLGPAWIDETGLPRMGPLATERRAAGRRASAGEGGAP
jgi:hypothetical protein